MLYSVVTMNKNIEAVQTPPIATRPISKWGIAAFIATIVSRWWLPHHVDADVALRAVVALAPIPIWFMHVRYAAQRMRLVDEMQRLIYYKAWLFAGLGTMFVMIALWQVQLIGLHGCEFFVRFTFVCVNWNNVSSDVTIMHPKK